MHYPFRYPPPCKKISRCEVKEKEIKPTRRRQIPNACRDGYCRWPAADHGPVGGSQSRALPRIRSLPRARLRYSLEVHNNLLPGYGCPQSCSRGCCFYPAAAVENPVRPPDLDLEPSRLQRTDRCSGRTVLCLSPWRPLTNIISEKKKKFTSRHVDIKG